jgi:hypothetical protein
MARRRWIVQDAGLIMRREEWPHRGFQNGRVSFCRALHSEIMTTVLVELSYWTGYFRHREGTQNDDNAEVGS